jgi:hypothetical protein
MQACQRRKEKTELLKSVGFNTPASPPEVRSDSRFVGEGDRRAKNKMVI